jgi:hypothetical protein
VSHTTTSINVRKEAPASGSRRARRAAALAAVPMAASIVLAGLSGTAQAAQGPTVTVSFTPATVSAGTQPQLTYVTTNPPSGSVLYLQVSDNGGQSWQNVARSNTTSGTTNVPADPEGIYEYRMFLSDNGTTLAVSQPATLTVTGPGGAMPTPAATAPTASAPPTPSASAAPSAPSNSGGIPWLHDIVHDVWDVIWDIILGAVLSWL